MQPDRKWIDVSATISNDMVHWPDDPPTHISKAEQIGVAGAVANVTKISCSAHVGTHIDAPLHFFANGTDVASIDINMLIGTATVIEIDGQSITLAEIQDTKIQQGDAVLFHTHNSGEDWECQPFNEQYVYLETDAAKYLVSQGVKCVGVDYLSVGGKDNNPDVHRLLLGNSIAIIEGLKLHNISAGRYEMICLPLKIKDSDGGPARVVLRPLS